MSYRTPLTEEAARSYATMPRTPDGLVISLFYVPSRQLAVYEAAWRTWLAEHPKHLWPNWVEAWGAQRTLPEG
jgi:hypothetical protein